MLFWLLISGPGCAWLGTWPVDSSRRKSLGFIRMRNFSIVILPLSSGSTRCFMRRRSLEVSFSVPFLGRGGSFFGEVALWGVGFGELNLSLVVMIYEIYEITENC